jgi:glutamine synthetase adenylyltransferase
LLSDEECRTLCDTYVFLRRAELRLQITQEQTVKAVKVGSKELLAWARSVFPRESGDAAVARFTEEWRTSTGATRQIMERVRDE